MCATVVSVCYVIVGVVGCYVVFGRSVACVCLVGLLESEGHYLIFERGSMESLVLVYRIRMCNTLFPYLPNKSAHWDKTMI